MKGEVKGQLYMLCSVVDTMSSRQVEQAEFKVHAAKQALEAAERELVFHKAARDEAKRYMAYCLGVKDETVHPT